MTESSATYAETLVAFRNLLSDGIDHPPYSEYVRGGVNLIADLFGIVERDTSERMEDVKADLRRIPMYADPNDLGRYGVAEYVHAPAAERGIESDVMPERKFYRTRITFDVLSEDPIHPYMDIAGIVAECDDGGYVMDSNQPNECVTVELSGAEMAQALHNAGSTPEFFQLDDAGNPIEEEYDGPS